VHLASTLSSLCSLSDPASDDVYLMSHKTVKPTHQRPQENQSIILRVRKTESSADVRSTNDQVSVNIYHMCPFHLDWTMQQHFHYYVIFSMLSVFTSKSQRESDPSNVLFAVYYSQNCFFLFRLCHKSLILECKSIPD